MTALALGPASAVAPVKVESGPTVGTRLPAPPAPAIMSPVNFIPGLGESAISMPPT